MGTDTHVPNVARRNLWNILNVDAGIPPFRPARFPHPRRYPAEYSLTEVTADFRPARNGDVPGRPITYSRSTSARSFASHSLSGRLGSVYYGLSLRDHTSMRLEDW